MSERSDIEIVFSNRRGAAGAAEIARTMIHVYVLCGYEYPPFDNMRKVNADGWVHYPGRYERYEEVRAFQQLWMEYSMLYRRFARNEVPLSREQEKVIRMFGHIRIDGCRLSITDRSGVGDDRMIEHQYFQDFYSMFCFLLAVRSPETSFEGMYRSFEPESYTKRVLTHAVWHDNVLTFEQMEGDPVYATCLISWTRTEDRFMKRSRQFPFIRVDILTRDHDTVKQDKELEQWILSVNDRALYSLAEDGEGGDAQMEMVCAKLSFMHNYDPQIMLRASSRELCVKYRDELVFLLSGRGYRTNLFSILRAEECTGENIRIPDSVTKIGDNAFRGRRTLKCIEIPENVTEIGTDAFRECLSLEEITIPDSVISIESFAFSLCIALKRVRLSKRLRKLDCGLFNACRSLEEIVIPDSVTEIGEYAFSGCSGLKEVILSEKVRMIRTEAFKGCDSLVKLVIPETVTQIGEAICKDCSPDLVIYGKQGSEAHRCAVENGCKFAEI